MTGSTTSPGRNTDRGDRSIAEELDPVEAERIARAPLPTPQTLWRRRFLPLQTYKFVETNLRIADIVLRERLGL